MSILSFVRGAFAFSVLFKLIAIFERWKRRESVVTAQKITNQNNAGKIDNEKLRWGTTRKAKKKQLDIIN